MAKLTNNQKADALPKELKDKLTQFVSEGKSITYMADKLKLDYGVVQTYLWQSGTLPWQGAKTIITRRLASLRNATKRQSRDELIDDIEERVDYLYYAARQLAAQMDKVKRSIPKSSG